MGWDGGNLFFLQIMQVLLLDVEVSKKKKN